MPNIVTKLTLVSLLIAGLNTSIAEPLKTPAILKGHSIIKADSFIEPPTDAPNNFKISGKYAGSVAKRIDTPESEIGTSFLSDKNAPRKTGGVFPLKNQALQGFSGIKKNADGTYWVLTDNGFGAKANSSDALLPIHLVKIDWPSQSVQILKTVFLKDPNKKAPFHIVTECSLTRYLTGSDFDPESIQITADRIWIGDEFGPYLLEFDLEGNLVSLFETEINQKIIKSPDHYTVTTPATPQQFTTQVRRSRGYEGMALSKDGQFLFPMLEGPLWDNETQKWEQINNQDYLRILKFDLTTKTWTNEQFKYALENPNHNIGDFNFIDASRALVIERDNGEGTVQCGKEITDQCHNIPAVFKRVYLIDFNKVDPNGFVLKEKYIDLMDIQDPDNISQASKDKIFNFPFVTIENVDQVDENHIIVANDNNYPFSSGRKIGKNDDNEFILLYVPELLAQ